MFLPVFHPLRFMLDANPVSCIKIFLNMFLGYLLDLYTEINIF